MEVFERIRGADSDIGSKFKDNKSPDVTVRTVSAPAQETFEWVQHGDASARRRARAHVTRGFRRQKAEAAQLAKAKSLPDATPPKDVPKKSPPPTPPRDEVEVGEARDKTPDAVIVRTIGQGKRDPFGTLPVVLDASEHAILDHFLRSFAPVSYSRDSRSDFNPLKALSFQVGLLDASAFHIIMAVGANDVDVMYGKKDSEMTLKHRGMGMTLVNKRLLNGDTSDMSIAGVALLAGNEIVFGTARNFDMHMNGLGQILKLRGGLETFRESNPILYAWINWLEYSGSCSFVRRRKLLPPSQATPAAGGLRTNPYGCPPDLLATIPAGYDLFEFVIKTLQQYQAMVSFMHSPTSTPKRQELSRFMQHVDKALYASIYLPNIKGNRGRRVYIQQCLHILSLTCGAVFVHADAALGELLFSRLDVLLTGEVKRCFHLFRDLCRALLKGVHLDEATLHTQVAGFLDACGVWEWEEWRDFHEMLFDFFLNDEVCAGPFQAVWRQRMWDHHQQQSSKIDL